MNKLKFYRILSIFLIVFSILSVVFTVYSVTLLKNIETFLRTMGCLLLVLLEILIIKFHTSNTRFLNKKKYIISTALILTLSFISFAVGIVCYSFYQKLDNMNVTEYAYRTALIATEDKGNIKDLKDLKIGIVDNEGDITGYILPLEVIEENKLEKNNEIVKVSDTITLMTKLLNNELDAIFIAHNYKEMFSNIENYDSKTTTFYEITTYGKNYQKEDIEDENIESKSETTKPFTVLLLGIDSMEDGIGNGGSYNGDSIILMAVDPATLHITMLSIPRDTYVTMACGGAVTKINHAAWGGTYCMVKTVEKLTGLNVDYYAAINFKGAVDLVNIIGGITIDVPFEFCEQDENRIADVYCLKTGVQKLNGGEALAFARHRKTLPLGDFQRGQNQQLVIEAILDSLKSVRSVKDFYKILETISNNIYTNMTVDEMLSLYNIGKNVVLKSNDMQVNITKTFLTGYSLMAYVNGNYSYTFQYYRSSLQDIVDALKVNLGMIKKKEIKEFNFSINKPYEKVVVGDKYYNEPDRPIMKDLTKMGLETAKTWAENNGLNVSVEYVEDNTGNYENNQIIYQSIHEDVLLETLNDMNLTINVVKTNGLPSEIVNVDEEENNSEEE